MPLSWMSRAAIITTCVLAACSSNRGTQTAAEPAAHVYPRARWRLADGDQLASTMLWPAHILIRHQDASREAPFSMAGWTLFEGSLQRTRADALRWARTLQQRLARDPEQFAELARRHSDDLATRAQGGRLGGVSASHLRPFPQVLDALAAIEVGHVSEVIETNSGFHILIKRAPVAERTLVGRRIVIGYQGADWLQFGARNDTPPVRSRAEALAVAHALVRRARAGEPVEDLIASASEHEDATRGGDLGAWSTHEPSHLSRELAVLDALEIGQVAEPLDSAIGIEVLQRTQAGIRAAYHAAAIRLSFNPSLADTETGSRGATAELARTLLQRVQRDPGSFGALQAQYCCSAPMRWTHGRGDVQVEAAITALPTLGFVPAPLQVGDEYLILQRRDPAEPANAPNVTFELPAPEHPNLERIARASRGDNLARYVRRLEQYAAETLQLEQRETEALHRVHAELALGLERAEESEARATLVRDATSRLRAELGQEAFVRYDTLLNQHVEALLLSSM